MIPLGIVASSYPYYRVTYEELVLSLDPAMYFKLDEGAGESTAYDSSGNGYHASYTGTHGVVDETHPTIAPGNTAYFDGVVTGSAYDYTASGVYRSTSPVSGPYFGSSWTISFWMLPDQEWHSDSGARHSVLWQQAPLDESQDMGSDLDPLTLWLRIAYGSEEGFGWWRAYGGMWEPTLPLEDFEDLVTAGEWFHVVVMKVLSSVYLYINGVNVMVLNAAIPTFRLNPYNLSLAYNWVGTKVESDADLVMPYKGAMAHFFMIPATIPSWKITEMAGYRVP